MRALVIYAAIILINVQLSGTSSSTLTCSGTLKPCGNKFCYDPATHSCSETGSNVTCIATCGEQCYDSKTHICINNTICQIGEDVCDVRYDTYYGNPIEPSGLRCFNQQSRSCLNHTICFHKDRTCNGQCILYGRWITSWSQSWYEGDYKICASDNVTLCTVPRTYWDYKPNQIQACNGSCFDIELGLQRCVNGSLECISSCNNVCYNTTTHVCLNGTICSQGQQACLTEYDLYYGTPSTPSRVQCYDPSNYKCINRALCSKSRICDEKCITGLSAPYQVCANDKRTLCNVTNYFDRYRPYQMHLCKDQCYDTTIRQCLDGRVSCIDDTCGDQCYDSEYQVCINGHLCPSDHQLCEIKYNDYTGQFMTLSQLQCYNPKLKACLNHTLCNNDRVCGDRCIIGYNSVYRVCSNGTICNVPSHYTNYKPNQISLCNNTCFDAGNPPLKHCINGSIECIAKCSSNCYNLATQICFNGTLCAIGQSLCHTYYGAVCYDSSSQKCITATLCPIGYELCYTGGCYDPSSQKCLNGTICNNNRICGGKCVTDIYQVCASDKKTVCNVTKPYYNYQVNQIQLCLGACYDSSVQQCTGDPSIICIEDPGNVICAPQNISSLTTTTDASSVSTSRGSSFSSSTVVSSASTTAHIINSSMTMSVSTVETSTLRSSSTPIGTTITPSSMLSSLTSFWTTLRSTLSQSMPYSTFITTATASLSTPTALISQTSASSTTETDSESMSISSTVMPTTSTSSISTQSEALSTTAPFPSSTAATTDLQSTSSTSASSTQTSSSSSSACCTVNECTTDADCCVRGGECQCYRHNQTHGFGSCLNPNTKPICSNGCLQIPCSSDVDCCRCQCGTITLTNVNGQIVTRKQCVSRQ